MNRKKVYIGTALGFLVVAIGLAVWFFVGRSSPKSESASQPATSSASAPSVIELYFRDQASGKCTLRPVPVAELTPKKVEEIFANTGWRDVPTMENLFRLLPYSVNYEICDGELVWPYASIMRYLLQRTPLDGAAIYDDQGHLPPKPTRKFAMINFRILENSGGGIFVPYNKDAEDHGGYEYTYRDYA